MKTLFWLLSGIFLVGQVDLAAAATVPTTGQISLTVTRDGSEIGSETFKFRQVGNQTLVDVNTKIIVKVAFITGYRYEHQHNEIWEGGKLVGMVSKTHDNGTDHVVELKTNGSELVGKADGKEVKYASDSLPVSFWNNDVLKKNTLISAMNGLPYNNLTITEAGDEALAIKDKTVPAKKYVMKGELERELWYDAKGNLLKVAFLKDGSKLEYVNQAQ